MPSNHTFVKRKDKNSLKVISIVVKKKKEKYSIPLASCNLLWWFFNYCLVGWHFSVDIIRPKKRTRERKRRKEYDRKVNPWRKRVWQKKDDESGEEKVLVHGGKVKRLCVRMDDERVFIYEIISIDCIIQGAKYLMWIFFRGK